MEIGTETQKKTGAFIHGWDCLKSLPAKSKAKAVEVAKNTKKQGQDDPRKIIHSLKVGLALTLVSLFYYFRPLYDSFGVSGMWAVLTVVVVFEFTVGATLSKSLNRGFATLLAGALGVGAQHLASLFGEDGEPIVLGILVFLLAAASTFSRFFPRIKARYDYGVLIFILTFSLVAVSGYRVDEIIQLAHERLSTILVGGATCIIISIFVCPVWAGEDLHHMIVRNMEKLASFFEGFGGEYFKNPVDGGIIVESTDDGKSFLLGYKSALNSKSSEESLANFASWEPCHGRFRFRHPWRQYLKIGALTRQCAYHIEAISAYINSEIQVPAEFRTNIQESCTKISSECSKALKELASAIKTMTDPSSADAHVENAKAAVKDLEIALNAASLEEADLLGIIPDATVASILIEIVKCVEKVSEAVHELSGQAQFKGVKPAATPEKPQLLHRGTIKPIPDGDPTDVIIPINETWSVSPDNENPKAASQGQKDASHVNMC